MTVPTGTSAPAPWTISTSVPSSSASSSTVAFSVSTSAMTSPRSTRSPTRFVQSAISAVSWSKPTFAISIGIRICLLLSFTRRGPGQPAIGTRGRASSTDGHLQDDLASVPPAEEDLERLARPVERQDGVDVCAQAAGRGQLEHGAVGGRVRARAAEDRDAVAEEPGEVELDDGPAVRAADDGAPAPGHRPQGLLPDRRIAGALDVQRRAARRGREDLVGERRLRAVVDDDVGAEPANVGGALLAAGRGDAARAVESCERAGRRADRPGRARDKDRVVGPQAGAVAEHRQRNGERVGHRGGLGETDAVGDAEDVPGGDGDVLGHPALAMDADVRQARAGLVLARHAQVARPARDRGLHDDPVTDGEAVHPGPEAGHDAGRVDAEDMRQGQGRGAIRRAAHREDVLAVGRDRADGDDDLVHFRPGTGQPARRQVPRTAARIFASDGSTNASSVRENGIGTSMVETRRIGPRSASKACSATRAAISAPTPQLWWHSSTTTRSPVFATDPRSVLRSNGTSVRGSTTSTEMPSAASVAAAARARWTMYDVATTVTSVPLRLTSATPKGIASHAAGTGPTTSNSFTWSAQKTGSSVSTAVRSSPYTSAA